MIGALLFFVVVFSAVFAQAAPITFNSALPVSEEEWIIRQQIMYGQRSGATDEITQEKYISTIGYGITPRLAVFGSMPLERTDLKSSAHPDRNAGGIGDAQLMGRYTVYQHDFKAGTFRISPFAGVELPTGETHERDGLGKLPASLQPGSGSWDNFIGIVASYASIEMNIDGQLYWQGNNEAHGIERGDVFKADISFQPRLYPREITADTTGFLYGAIEFNLEHEVQTETNGSKELQSGGTRFFVTPGLHYTTRRWMAELAMQMPLIQNLNGADTDQDYKIVTGFRYNFWGCTR